MTKRWEITIEGKKYSIVLEHNPWTNVQEIYVNDQSIYTTPGKLPTGGVTSFIIEGHTCVVIIANKILGFAYDLAVDGNSVTTQKHVHYQTKSPVATVANGIVHKSIENRNK